MPTYSSYGIEAQLCVADIDTNSLLQGTIPWRDNHQKIFSDIEQHFQRARPLTERTIRDDDGYSVMRYIGDHHDMPFFLTTAGHNIHREHQQCAKALPKPPTTPTTSSSLTSLGSTPSDMVPSIMSLDKIQTAIPRTVEAFGAPAQPCQPGKILILKVDIPLEAYLKLHDKAGYSDIKLEIFINGELVGSSFCVSRDRAKSKTIHYLSGTRVGKFSERPWAMVMPCAASKIGPTDSSPGKQWEQVGESLKQAAITRGTNDFGDCQPAADYLRSLAKMPKPIDLEETLPSSGLQIGIVDVILTLGTGKKFDQAMGLIAQPARLADERYTQGSNEKKAWFAASRDARATKKDSEADELHSDDSAIEMGPKPFCTPPRPSQVSSDTAMGPEQQEGHGSENILGTPSQQPVVDTTPFTPEFCTPQAKSSVLHSGPIADNRSPLVQTSGNGSPQPKRQRISSARSAGTLFAETDDSMSNFMSELRVHAAPQPNDTIPHFLTDTGIVADLARDAGALPDGHLLHRLHSQVAASRPIGDEQVFGGIKLTTPASALQGYGMRVPVKQASLRGVTSIPFSRANKPIPADFMPLAHPRSENGITNAPVSAASAHSSSIAPSLSSQSGPLLPQVTLPTRQQTTTTSNTSRGYQSVLPSPFPQPVVVLAKKARRSKKQILAAKMQVLRSKNEKFAARNSLSLSTDPGQSSAVTGQRSNVTVEMERNPKEHQQALQLSTPMEDIRSDKNVITAASHRPIRKIRCVDSSTPPGPRKGSLSKVTNNKGAPSAKATEDVEMTDVVQFTKPQGRMLVASAPSPKRQMKEVIIPIVHESLPLPSNAMARTTAEPATPSAKKDISVLTYLDMLPGYGGGGNGHTQKYRLARKEREGVFTEDSVLCGFRFVVG